MSDEIAYLRAVIDNENGGNVHAIRLEYPGIQRYQAVCACGAYRSKAYHFPGKAEAAGRHHIQAKAGQA